MVIFPGSYAVLENSNYYLPLTNIVTSVCPWGFGDKGQPGVPGPIEILNTNAAPIVSGDNDASPIQAVVGAACQAGDGRIVGLGHDGFFINGALNLYDNKQFGVNIINWLQSTQNKKKVLITTGHGEPWVGSGECDDFYAELRNEGYTVDLFSGTVTSSSLSDVSILFISCPGPSLSDAEIDTIRSFVSNGGGLLMQGLGWAWVSYEKKSLDEYPVNKLAMPYGFKWIGGYISDPTNDHYGCPVFHEFFPNSANYKDRSEKLKPSQFPTETENRPPILRDLTYVPTQDIERGPGITLNWNALGSDPDDDPIFYRFFLNGKPATDWSNSNTWNSSIDLKEIREVDVWIRDGKHADQNAFDSCIATKINSIENGYISTTSEIDNIARGNKEGYVNFTTEVYNNSVSYHKPIIYLPQSNFDNEFSHSNSNLPPTAEGLTPNPASPQEVGAMVTWTATASDPENDPLYYKFLLNGPSTGEKWTIMQDFSTKNTWTWNVKDNDIGSSDVSVLIMDRKHADASNMDDFKNSSDYKIIAKQLSNIDVQVMNGLYTDRDRNVYYCQEGKYLYFRNRLYLTGPDLDKVAKVKYILPQSFPNPEQISQDASNNFEIWILTWGRFNGIALVTTKSGQQLQIPYNIAFKDKVEAAKSQGIPMVQNCEG
jgi:hypothetical protein